MCMIRPENSKQNTLRRPKKNIARDFSDGVLMSEVVHHFFPRLVDLHNYSKSNSNATKEYNWKTLNAKAFKKMGFEIPMPDIQAVVSCEKGAIERVLCEVQLKMATYQERLQNKRGNTGSSKGNTRSPNNGGGDQQTRTGFGDMASPNNGLPRDIGRGVKSESEKDAIIEDLRETVDVSNTLSRHLS